MMLYNSSGMPTWVPDSLIASYLKPGYLKSRPRGIVTNQVQKILTNVVEEKRLFVPTPTPGFLSPIAQDTEEKSLRPPPDPNTIAPLALEFLNVAKEKELLSIKGIGPAIANKIIESRPINSKEQLHDISSGAKWDDIIAKILE